MTVMPRVCPVISILPLFVIACVGHATGSDDPGGDSAIGPDPDPDPGHDPADATDDTSSSPPSARRLVAYFAAWSVYGRDYHVAEIPADHLTHLNYAFANVSYDLECVLGDTYADPTSFAELATLKQAHPHLRTIISVGGWSWSGRFPAVAATAESRLRFARSCAAFAAQYGFDGVDIDWEYPGAADAINFVLLLRALRVALDDQAATDGKTYSLTIAAPAAAATASVLSLEEMVPLLDWINLMTYDFHGGWEATTGHNSPLDGDPHDLDIDTAVQTYLGRGVPAGKLVVGVPFYGRGWSGVPATNDGLYQPSTSLPSGTWEQGVFDYHDLQAHYVPTMTRHFDAVAEVPWLYDAARGLMISYDDPESLAAKGAYVVAHGMGGAMVWELSSDTTDGALIGALRASLGAP